jgi:hypothetical protein
VGEREFSGRCNEPCSVYSSERCNTVESSRSARHHFGDFCRAPSGRATFDSGIAGRKWKIAAALFGGEGERCDNDFRRTRRAEWNLNGFRRVILIAIAVILFIASGRQC